MHAERLCSSSVLCEMKAPGCQPVGIGALQPPSLGLERCRGGRDGPAARCATAAEASPPHSVVPGLGRRGRPKSQPTFCHHHVGSCLQTCYFVDYTEHMPWRARRHILFWQVSNAAEPSQSGQEGRASVRHTHTHTHTHRQAREKRGKWVCIGPPIGAEGAGGNKIHGSQWDGLQQGRQAGAVLGSGSRRGGRLQGCSGWSVMSLLQYMPPPEEGCCRLGFPPSSPRQPPASSRRELNKNGARAIPVHNRPYILHADTADGITGTAASRPAWRQWPCQTGMETPPVGACRPCSLANYLPCPLPPRWVRDQNAAPCLHGSS